MVETWTKTQLTVFFVMILLAIDEMNPVKMLVHTVPSVQPWHVAATALIVMTYIFISDLKNLLYSGIRVFFHSIISIFLSNVDIIGRDHIPYRGPVLFTINHANQFMDAVMVMCTCGRQVSYLMAESSWKRRIIGDLAWALGVVPVKRAQDNASPGSGKVRVQQGEEKVQGIDTKFTSELEVGDKMRLAETAHGLKITNIASDTEVSVSWEDFPSGFEMPNNSSPLSYDVLKRTPLNVVFSKVLDKLAVNGAVGIFPEGGSHDRTDLLPLKIGISLIAYSALEQHGLRIPVVPVGLSYFGAHRWRGRAVVEYGKPVYIDPATLPDFVKGDGPRRAVCQDFLEQIESAMRSVIVSSQDYETLELLHTARRLYQKRTATQDVQEKQDLARRFTMGYQRLLKQVEGSPPKEWLELQDRLKDYQKELKELGLKDYQVTVLAGEHVEDETKNVDGDVFLRFLKMPYNIVHLLVLLAVAAVPTVLLNLPVGIMAGVYAERRRVKALAKSKVKIKGLDVMLTEKVVFCIVMVPTLWLAYFLVLKFTTQLDGSAIALIMLSMPIFSYTGIVVAEAGMVDWKDLRPYIMRVLPNSRKRLAALPEKRRRLQADLRAFIRKIGPRLGELYYGKELDWAALQETARKTQEKEEKEQLKKSN